MRKLTTICLLLLGFGLLVVPSVAYASDDVEVKEAGLEIGTSGKILQYAVSFIFLLLIVLVVNKLIGIFIKRHKQIAKIEENTNKIIELLEKNAEEMTPAFFQF